MIIRKALSGKCPEGLFLLPEIFDFRSIATDLSEGSGGLEGSQYA